MFKLVNSTHMRYFLGFLRLFYCAILRPMTMHLFVYLPTFSLNFLAPVLRSHRCYGAIFFFGIPKYFHM